jgi:hypothetical protein
MPVPMMLPGRAPSFGTGCAAAAVMPSASAMVVALNTIFLQSGASGHKFLFFFSQKRRKRKAFSLQRKKQRTFRM